MIAQPAAAVNGICVVMHIKFVYRSQLMLYSVEELGFDLTGMEKE